MIMITYNSHTNDVIYQPSLLMLPNFIICGHISHQQESSGRVILDFLDYPWYVLIYYYILMFHMFKMMSKYIESNGKHTLAVNQRHPQKPHVNQGRRKLLKSGGGKIYM